MDANMSHRPILLSDIDIDFDWNSRNPAEVRTSSYADETSGGLEGLIANLRLVGQTTPVDVRSAAAPFYRDAGGKPYALVTGFRRLSALTSIYAKGGDVPGLARGHVLAVDRGTLSERDAFLLNARENGNRESLSPPDTIMMIKRARALGIPKEHLAVQLGFAPQIVSSYSRVAELPTDMLTHWRFGGDFRGRMTQKRLGIQEMIAIARAPDPAAAYLTALDHRKSRERRGSRLEKTSQQAAATGALLARLTKKGIVKIIPDVDWLSHIDAIVGARATKRLRLDDATALADTAKRAFDDEMNR